MLLFFSVSRDFPHIIFSLLCFGGKGEYEQVVEMGRVGRNGLFFTGAGRSSAVEAVTDVAAPFGEELVVFDGDVDGFAVAGGFHGDWG